MFSALSQGSSVYILDKTSSPKYSIGEVVGVSQPKINYNGQSTVDLRVNVDNTTQEFSNLLSINSINTYNGGKIVISETKQGIQNEVESILENSKKIINNIDVYKQNIIDCEGILKELNPQFAIDKERDERLSNLENRFDGFESKLDKIFNLVQK